MVAGQQVVVAMSDFRLLLADLVDALPKCVGPADITPDHFLPARWVTRTTGTCGNPATHYLVNGADTRDVLCDECADAFPRGPLSARVEELPYGQALRHAIEALKDPT